MNYKELLDKNNIKIFTTEKLTQMKKYDFQCESGHNWNARLDNVLRGLKRLSKGCPHCAKEVTDRLSEEAVKNNLIDGHMVISYELKITDLKKNRKERFYKIKCPHEHIYEKRSSKMQEGCPKCSTGVFVGEERVKVIFETHFGKRFKKIRPEWLKNPNAQSKMEIDGYNQELKVGFEYQGRQHYSNNTQFAGEQENQFNRDELKKSICEKNNVKLYIIDQPSSYAEDKFIENVIFQLEKQGLLISKEMQFCFKDINEDISLKNKYNEFKSIVEQQKVELLSKSLSTMEDELDFKCEEGHYFKMNGLKFKNIVEGKKGRNYICIDCNPEQHKKENLDIENIKLFASSIGFKLISTEYKGVIEPMDWICKNGHTFRKNYRSFQRSKTGNYCDECAKTSEKKVLNGLKTQFKTNSGQVITLKTIQDFAKSINYKLITNNYTNVNDKMDWICNNGHKVHKSYRQFQRNKTGNYCDECVKENPSLKVINGLAGQFKTNSGDVIDLNTVIDFAKKIGYQLVSNSYNNVNEKMHWICKNGHELHKSYRQFQRNKTGNYCEECKKQN